VSEDDELDLPLTLQSQAKAEPSCTAIAWYVSTIVARTMLERAL
jgi:hypothetical protein